jgi:hypothetical protein
LIYSCHEPTFKNCATCGRSFEWRKKWEKTWAEVKYCSDRCRGEKNKAKAGNYESRLLDLLAKRGSTKTICPSEILPPELKSDSATMEKVRQAARRLVHAGKIEIVQKGKVVDPSDFRGPIRLRIRK